MLLLFIAILSWFLVKIALCSGADLIPQNCTSKMFLRLHWGNSKGDARGVEVPEELCKELPQKKWEQAARQVLRKVEPEPDFNVAFLTEQKWRLTARAGDPDQRHVNVTAHHAECQLEHNNFFLFKHKRCMFF